jgi:hypothetical protein|tara:strand:+ start:367 stop:1020 length:654 start_codon:yes stop_codon:yes gene_type:complete
MKLITEINEDLEVFEIEEDSSGKKSLFLEGVFLQSETLNRNKRLYPRPILEREVKRYKKDYIKENRAFGELGHPEGPTINLERVSHMITDLRRSGNDWVGRAKVLRETPYGKIVEGILKEGAKLGVSSRGMGSLDEQSNGTKIVKDDYYLATAADIVADPSAPNAFVNGIMEGREWVWNNGNIQENEVAAMKRNLDVPTKKREELALQAFEQFLSKL